MERRKKFTMYDVDNLIIASLFSKNGTLSVKQATEQILELAKLTYGKKYQKHCSKVLLAYDR